MSHTDETLEKYVFYIDLEMILVPFFDIPNQKPVIWKRLNFLLYDRPPLVWFHQNYTKGGLSGSRKIGLFQITGFWLGISKNGTNINSRSIRNTYFSKVSWVWLQNFACHTLLKFKLQMGMAGTIFEPHLWNFGKICILYRP